MLVQHSLTARNLFLANILFHKKSFLVEFFLTLCLLVLAYIPCCTSCGCTGLGFTIHFSYRTQITMYMRLKSSSVLDSYLGALAMQGGEVMAWDVAVDKYKAQGGTTVLNTHGYGQRTRYRRRVKRRNWAGHHYWGSKGGVDDKNPRAPKLPKRRAANQIVAKPNKLILSLLPAQKISWTAWLRVPERRQGQPVQHDHMREDRQGGLTPRWGHSQCQER